MSGHENSKSTGRVLRRLYSMVLFLSDVAYFVKRWHPVKVSFRSRLSTKMLWRMARKRREIRAYVLEKNKQNVTDDLQEKEN
jgi:Na+/H+ antiporter NhaD/arsenite permease-like protein